MKIHTEIDCSQYSTSEYRFFASKQTLTRLTICVRLSLIPSIFNSEKWFYAFSDNLSSHFITCERVWILFISQRIFTSSSYTHIISISTWTWSLSNPQYYSTWDKSTQFLHIFCSFSQLFQDFQVNGEICKGNEQLGYKNSNFNFKLDDDPYVFTLETHH